ncbi:hypothetical protein ASG17_13140 [Brevundimonas sp. Leaf363]|uniref:hypothetical protein n=1 Tax=Brevundimonas sp. Leaf363 TaxID=1736353 RepID=UPI0006FFA319|nr:hypothetical protein [Brevundimonas sp. Leaf363]KQS53899.1 hypothetical protein ASG17_13140 [Brevundimonas sp. Leaf363]
MTSAPDPTPDPRPAHYRLSTETWAMILEEYKGGATARALSAKWRVSEHAIRKRATQHGATKRDHGDAQARAGAAARAAAMEAALADAPQAWAARLFLPEDLDAPDEGDAAALAHTALMASGRAMRGRLWTEARALAGLAESYARLGARAEAATELTPETAPLSLIYRILMRGWEGFGGRFSMTQRSRNQDEEDLKAAFWSERKSMRDAEAVLKQWAEERARR